MNSSPHMPGPAGRGLLVLLAIAGLMHGGCRWCGKWKRGKSATAGAAVVESAPIPRRVFVVTGRTGVAGQEEFVAELVAALNKIRHCEVVCVPAPLPIDRCSALNQQFEPQVVIDPLRWPPLSPSPDTVLYVDLTELRPYRPMRLSARIELRDAHSGQTLYQKFRTWDAPSDLEPMPPSHLNLKLLHHPPPAALQEDLALGRLSPRVLMSHVAAEVACEILSLPLSY